jgi:hypothetical protein
VILDCILWILISVVQTLSFLLNVLYSPDHLDEFLAFSHKNENSNLEINKDDKLYLHFIYNDKINHPVFIIKF